jgi:hypothetical protein
VPADPEKVQFVTLTTPETALRPEHEASVPPEAISVIVVEALVTMLPAESSIFTTGWVESVAPEAPATGCVVKTSLAALPKLEGVKFTLVAVVRALAMAVRL